MAQLESTSLVHSPSMAAQRRYRQRWNKFFILG